MSVHSRYKKMAKYIEKGTDAKRTQVLRERIPEPLNRKDRRAMESAARSKRGLLVTRTKRIA